MIPEEHARAGIEGVEVITESNDTLAMRDQDRNAARLEDDEVLIHAAETDNLRISAHRCEFDAGPRYHLAFTEQSHPRAVYSATLFLTMEQARSLLRVLSQAMNHPKESA